MKELFDMLKAAEFMFQFVDCSYTGSISEPFGVCVEAEENILKSYRKLYTLTDGSKELNDCQVLLESELRKQFKKQICSTP